MKLFVFLLFILTACNANAQFGKLLKKVEEAVEKAVEEVVEEVAGQGATDTPDSTKEEVTEKKESTPTKEKVVEKKPEWEVSKWMDKDATSKSAKAAIGFMITGQNLSLEEQFETVEWGDCKVRVSHDPTGFVGEQLWTTYDFSKVYWTTAETDIGENGSMIFKVEGEDGAMMNEYSPDSGQKFLMYGFLFGQK